MDISDRERKISEYIKTSGFNGRYRKIKYVVTDMHGNLYKKGYLEDLIKSIPFLLYPAEKRFIPPLSVLNSVFGCTDPYKISDCVWEPFQIERTEFEALVASLLGDRNVQYQYVEPPDWIKTFRDWSIWAFDYLHQAPSDEHRRLIDEWDRLDREIKKSIRENDEQGWLSNVRQGQSACDKYMEFIRKYKKET
jgi:hypothetical protein